MRKFAIFISNLILLLLALSMIFPFIVMVYLSFVPTSQIFSHSYGLNLSLDNYRNVFNDIPVLTYFLNSLIVAVLSTIGQVLIASLAGYAFARFDFKGKNVLFFIILLTMMIPPQVNIIPLFFLMRELHMVNTYSALILPALFGGFGIFMMRQFFLGLPKELEESALLDGCNLFQTFFKICLPLALPAVVTLTIFTFVLNWNSFMWPLIVTSSEGMRTLPVGFAIFKGSFREITLWGELLACAVICIIPVIVVFLAGRKYFINDLIKGAVKE